MKKAVGYIRVSTKKQVKSGLSLSDQEEKIRSYCKFKDLELVKIYTDTAVSGAVPFRDRPEGRNIWNKNIEFGAVVIAKLDRAFRNTADCITTSETWQKDGIAFHIVDLGIDSTTPLGEFFLVLLAALGKLERNMIHERIEDAIEVKRSRGEKLGGRIPFGFDVKEEAGRKILVRNDEEAEVVDLMLDLKNQVKYSFYKITKLLNERGIPTKNGNPWKLQTTIDVIRRSQDVLPPKRS